MTPIILASPLKYENNKANTLNTKVFNDTDAFEHIDFNNYDNVNTLNNKKFNFFTIEMFDILDKYI